jgi:hypothetical protein
MNPDKEIFTISINDIQQKQNAKDKYRMQVHKRLLEKCYYKIKTASESEESYCLYRVPEFIIGEPIYNLPECILFIITNLKNSGFLIKYYKPNLIYITWKIKRRYNIVVTNKNLLTNSSIYDIGKKSNKIGIKDSDITICDIKKKNRYVENNKFKLVNNYIPKKNFLYKK